MVDNILGLSLTTLDGETHSLTAGASTTIEELIRNIQKTTGNTYIRVFTVAGTDLCKDLNPKSTTVDAGIVEGTSLTIVDQALDDVQVSTVVVK